LLSYKLIGNFCIKEAGKWLNQEESIDISNLEKFNERVLCRILEILGVTKRKFYLYSDQSILGL
jgi:transposase